MNELQNNKCVVAYSPNLYISKKYRSYGLSESVELIFPKYIELPYYAIEIASKITNKKDNFIIWESKLGYDKLRKNQIGDNFQKTLAYRISKNKTGCFSNKKENEEEIIEKYYIIYEQEDSKFFIKQKNMDIIEFTFLINNKFILPVYIKNNKTLNCDIYDILIEELHNLKDEEIKDSKFSNLLNWLIDYSPNMELYKKDWYINCCDYLGELAFLKYIEVKDTIKLIGCRII